MKDKIKNPYIYVFYILAVFARTVNKKDDDYAFTSITLISFAFGVNILGLIFLISDVNFSYEKDLLKGILFTGGLIGLNYYCLMRDGKGKRIISYYDRYYKSHSHSKWRIVLVVLYFLLSFLITGYIAYSTKK